MDTTKAEDALMTLLQDAREALLDREYVRLEARLTAALLDARSLRLLGPEGARGIPVNESRPVRVRGYGPSLGTIRHDLPAVPGYVMVEWANGACQAVPEVDVADAPLGAGDAVEAYRG